ncbi:hypothetical protein [Gordonia sp. N1V]|uniref:hypothetical protein n=1 Tax=Gordonia sp. N1V TaxID=3034163 RepID=UPI0023E3431A|nr:hypothetical protein [Gordonia sp. N1V]MDF3280925.1 hypothetical protein [Gordonia sp. N1V]
MRDGDWTHDQYVTARLANELMLLRGDHAAANGATMKPKLLESPAQLAEREEQRHLQESLHNFLHDQMTGKLVLPNRNRGPMVTEDGVMRRD